MQTFPSCTRCTVFAASVQKAIPGTALLRNLVRPWACHISSFRRTIERHQRPSRIMHAKIATLSLGCTIFRKDRSNSGALSSDFSVHPSLISTFVRNVESHYHKLNTLILQTAAVSFYVVTARWQSLCKYNRHNNECTLGHRPGIALDPHTPITKIKPKAIISITDT